MGRARNRQVQAVAAVTNFNAVLGGRRGSVGAQAQRDANEENFRVQTRVQAQARFVDEANASGYPIIYAWTLVEAYEGGRAQPGTESYDQLVEKLAEEALESGESNDIRALADIIFRGDPDDSPGLVMPAVDVLELICKLHLSYEVASEVVLGCFPALLKTAKSQKELYQRIEPLCAVLAPLITMTAQQCKENNVKDRNENAVDFCWLVAQSLRAAPVSMLDSKLKPWVEAMTERAHAGALSKREQDVFRLMIADQILNPVLGGKVAPVFAAIAKSV